MQNFKIVWLNGMPRSGTSWLSQIFDSHSDVRFRLSPLFSYAFKNFVNKSSSKQRWDDFFTSVYNKEGDPFMEQIENKRKGSYPIFEKKEKKPSFLVIKDTRYHNLTQTILTNHKEVKFIHIIRNPCASICSWLRAPKEFPSTDDPLMFWRSGDNKKKGRIEEFWGFEDWKKLTNYYLTLEANYPDQVMTVCYEKLVENTLKLTSKMFEFVGLELLEDQTIRFIRESQSKSVEDVYSVYKRPEQVMNRWEQLLDDKIIRDIRSELKDTKLEKFLL